MGVSIVSKGSKYSFDCGYGGFFQLRRRIAEAIDPELGEVYCKLLRCYTNEDYREHDRLAAEVINRKKLDKKYKKVIDFLYMPDCEGKISPKTCKLIYELIKDIDFGTDGFRYGAYRHNDYEEFKLFLQDCVKNHKKMKWY